MHDVNDYFSSNGLHVYRGTNDKIQIRIWKRLQIFQIEEHYALREISIYVYIRVSTRRTISLSILFETIFLRV